MTQTIEEKRIQVAAQWRVVAHLCRALVDIADDSAKIVEAKAADPILDIQGNQSAALMELLGDWLSNMDAVTAEDEWTDPVFEGAHKMFPDAIRAALEE